MSNSERERTRFLRSSWRDCQSGGGAELLSDHHQQEYLERILLEADTQLSTDLDQRSTPTIRSIQSMQTTKNLLPFSLCVQEMYQLEAVSEAGTAVESLYVGDGRLSRIKSELHSRQMETEFVDGALICNKRIRIRFDPPDNLEIDGPISLDYFLVRKTIDEMYKIK